MKTKITVVCLEEGYPEPLIYSVAVDNPNDRESVCTAIQAERDRDLGDAANPMHPLFAFTGDLTPCADWRD